MGYYLALRVPKKRATELAAGLAEPLLAGRYAHIRELGRGATGRVLLLADRVEGGRWAAKLVSRADAERLRWEMSLLASLAHPGLARVHELVSVTTPLGPPFRLEPGTVALLQEHAPGASASEAVAALAEDAERARFAVAVGLSVSRALAALHAAGLVHGDVKPTNVVVPDNPSEAKLIDLGLARPIGSEATLSGTPAFLAPEAWLGDRTAATDLYALGATLHALLTGRSAYDTAGSTVTISEALAHRPRVEDLPPAMPLALRRLIGDLLAERASERPASAREVALRLASVATEIGLLVDDSAGVSEAPSPAERAARARLRPLIGRASALRDLIARLVRRHGDVGSADVGPDAMIAVTGPRGAGRSRLVREAVRAVQSASARADTPVPTFVRVRDRPPRVDHHAIVHVDSDAPDVAAFADALEAASVSGLRWSVIFEVEDVSILGFGPERRSDDAIELGPLGDDELRTLVAELLEVAPSARLVEAARSASGGLPGRLCRLVAEGFERGLDPARPATLEELSRRDEGAVSVPEGARALAELLAVAGGARPAEPAARALPAAPAQARSLGLAGLAHEDGSGRVALRDDARRWLVRSIGGRSVELAAKLDVAELDALGAAHVLAARGELAAAGARTLDAMREARAGGDPERAASIGADALDELEPTDELRLATADALRARAREADALTILDGGLAPAIVAARAELARLGGDLARAGREARAVSALPSAQAVLARIALSRGALDEAIEHASVDAEEPTVRARLLEVRAWASLMGGDAAVAASLADDAVRAAKGSRSDAALSRALSVKGAVAHAGGRHEEAAAIYAEAFELADRAGERHAAASLLVNVGLGRLERGDAGPAIEALREGARRLTELGRRGDAARALYNLGNAAALVGDDDLAREAVRRARDWAIEAGDASASAYASVVEAELAIRAGKLREAARLLELTWAAELPDAVRVTVGARLAIVEAVRDRLDAARSALAATEGLRTDASALAEREVAATRVALAEGRVAEAAERASRAIELAESAGWEAQLRARLVAAEAFERAGMTARGAQSLTRARALLDGLASTLPARARARLRAVPAYQRALGAAPREHVELHRGTPWEALARHAKALVREPRLGRLREAIVDAAVELSGAERGFFVERRADGSLDVRAARAFGADLVGERPSASVTARALDGGRPMVTVDALEDDRLGAAASVHQMALRSVLALPLPSSGGRASALVLDDRLRPGAFDGSVVAVIGDLAELAAGAIERAEALRLARRESKRLARDKARLAERAQVAEEQLTELKRHAAGPVFAGIVAESESMRRVLRLVERVAVSDAPVLVRGESGTGKELVARAVHDASPRRDAAYVSENCSAIPHTLLESTLFGHVRGAFTGAEQARRGLFEIADGGTLFLDEIGEMSESMQAKLLRVLSDGELRPVGSERTRTVDVRVVAATHRDLELMVKEGGFREDLFYRLAVVQVDLPALRERPEDVAPLVAAFLERHSGERRVRVDAAALAALRAYAWPGNVRQLENEIRRALVLADDFIGLPHISPTVRGLADDAPLDALDLKGQVDALERRLIRQALERTDGNQTRAAALLGVSRYGLSKMTKRLGVE